MAFLLDFLREFTNKCASFSNVFARAKCHCVLGQVENVMALGLKVVQKL